MRFIVMHKTNARWEAGAVPDSDLIARVGALLGEMAKAQILLGAEGLRASSHGARLRYSQGTCTITPGPFEGSNELPAGFDILRVASLDQAVEWAARLAEILGDVEIDIRPVTEAWDIGLAPKPPHIDTRRYMALRKATAASEAGVPLSPQQRADVARLVGEMQRAGVHLAGETLRPSRRGRRYKSGKDGLRVVDGPFTESKELVAGYVILAAAALEEAARWADRYIEAVAAHEVDLRQLEDTR
jgi:hypothetical protein